MTVAITGNTYPVKDQLKALGARWDAARKAWMVPDAKAATARKLVADGAPSRSCLSPAIRREYYQRRRAERYGWDGVVGSPSYYSSGAYDESGM